jgi:hypothetical protein
MGRGKDKEYLFCGFTPYCHKIKKGERSMRLAGGSKVSTDLSRNRDGSVCVVRFCFPATSKGPKPRCVYTACLYT